MGSVEGENFGFGFDFGYYSNPLDDYDDGQYDITIDTFDNHYRKIVISKDPKKGYAGIYLKDLNLAGIDKPNDFIALTMTTGDITEDQQLLALEIFKTARVKAK